MKKMLLLVVILLSFTSCKKTEVSQPTRPKVEYRPKYEKGELVYVDKESFIVEYYDDLDELYCLRKVDCRSSSCNYYILEGEITKTLK